MPSTDDTRPGPIVRLATRAVGRRLRLPPPTTGYRVTRDIPVPMRDGARLRTDLHVPVADAAGTVLIRTPYGRANLPSAVIAGIYAERGYRVVIQSVRGTFGSEGVFDPGRSEAEDAADTVAWMRAQPWFDGQFATVGSSYLGFTQWALLADPPPELSTSVIAMAPHDLAQSGWGTGTFVLADHLSWSFQLARQEDGGSVRALVRMAGMPRRLARPLRMVPLSAAGAQMFGDRAPWHEPWLRTPDLADPYWHPVRLGHALARADVPVLLMSGWQDVFLTQTLDQYRQLADRGREPALVVGPWTHGDGGGEVLRETLRWLDGDRRPGVRVCVTGGGGWRELPAWPPPATGRVLHLRPRAGLGEQPVPGEQTLARFVFDPHDPTPTLGGRLLFTPNGYLDDTALAARGDVVTFTGPALAEDLEVIGVPRIELAHGADTGWADVWVRISEVGPDGRSRNVSDGYISRAPGDPQPLTLDLDPIAHRFAAGARIRVAIAGGCHPRYARNPGTGEPVWSADRLLRSTHTIGAGSRLILPIPV
ncbi:CocE/NonD family hydrolase [Mycolicibacterium diernhoferi]|uniref:Hydrolase n=1 Tax=Mycolicibacterium diernhoferi TaxID=1801 RepID=A0A1Q4H5H3_9MYCO|nr:CocE/NonD family hydrolase [Mycolicibacterium diernhoferi]OJZ62788.1 hydrolase [Mycolicibacterium diernhoferi]OPE53554.1 hydrolase [Mycolicibacterium diernhoferi]PEG55427.1 hydrolase [Mycolicibacterium diernhoferi]QYL24345.1 CocE/NonD family hydrolase [Mycolicibacterium diernhoferi]